MTIRLIIAGTRDLKDAKAHLWKLLQARPDLFASVAALGSGRSGKVDLAGEAWARWRGIPIEPFPYPSPAELLAKGIEVADPVRAGGPLRNRWMAEWAAQVPGSLLVLLWDGRSPGSASMRREALRVGLRLVEVIIP